jgi:hypothetical protein
MEKLILTSSYDKDTGILNLRLLSGEQYYVTNAGHARILREKTTPGGRLSLKQIDWLEKYRVPERGSVQTAALRNKIRTLRRELGIADDKA